jgi:MFS family permease
MKLTSYEHRLYTFALTAGSSIGFVVSGFVGFNASWRVFFYLCTGLAAFFTVTMFMTLPETLFPRLPPTQAQEDDELDKARIIMDESNKIENTTSHLEDGQLGLGTVVIGKPPNPYDIMKSLPTQVYTQEPVWKIPLRSCILILMPSVLWASLVMSVLIGFLVAISTNLSVAFAETYHFSLWQIGLCSVAGVIGAILAIFFGGKLSDSTVDYLATKNNGIKKPEMRLPPMILAAITGPLALVLYGLGIENGWHWIIPTLGLGFCEYCNSILASYQCLAALHVRIWMRWRTFHLITYSELYHCPGCKHFGGLYGRLLPNYRWRSHCYAICF